MYYANKLESLRSIFGTDDVELESRSLRVGSRRCQIRHDVIDLSATTIPGSYAEDIQYTFGAEWKAHPRVLPEHEHEFSRYFDLVDVHTLGGARVCDLGCGSGRWSYFMKDCCRELVLVDFSDAIYVARDNLRGADHCLFFKGDLTQLPFRHDFSDFIFCLGVLHHLPVPCLRAVRELKRFAPRLLVYLYHSLEDRPVHFRALLRVATLCRLGLSRVQSPRFRAAFSLLGAVLLYEPLVATGRLLAPLGMSLQIPLYESYRDKGRERIRQDVYDRFFTRIEQRVTGAEIAQLRDAFTEVRISPDMPYWHFLCVR